MSDQAKVSEPAAHAEPLTDVDRELAQAEHEIRTVALIEWGMAGTHREALQRWASVIREALAQHATQQAALRELIVEASGLMKLLDRQHPHAAVDDWLERVARLLGAEPGAK